MFSSLLLVIICLNISLCSSELVKLNVLDECFAQKPNATSENQQSSILSALSPFLTLLKAGKSVSTPEPTKACDEQNLMDALNEHTSDLKNQIAGLQANLVLQAILLHMHSLFDDVYSIYQAMKVYWLHMEHDALIEFERKCTARSPRDVLYALEIRSVQRQLSIFGEVSKGCEYSESCYNNVTQVLLSNIALCALLAPQCDSILYKNSSLNLVQLRLRNMNKSLEAIKWDYKEVKRHQRSTFRTHAVRRIEESLNSVHPKLHSERQIADHVFNLLSNSYSFREWAVMIYGSVHRAATKVHSHHSHESSSDNWFYHNNKRHRVSIVVHSSDRERNCSLFAQKLHGKKLEDFFSDSGTFMRFVEEEELDRSITMLKQHLQGNGLPQDYFFSVINVQDNFAIRREHDFHFFEHIRHPETRMYMKSVLIGWC